MKPFKIEPMQSAPRFLSGMASKVNALVRAVRILGRIEGDGPIKITYSDSNVKIGLQRPLGEEIAIAAGRVVRGSPAAGETYSQVKSAMEAAYTAISLTPQVGDVIELGDAELLYLVRPDEDAMDTAIPGQSGDDIDRVKVVVGGETVTAYRVDGSGEAADTRTFRGSITIADDPHPSEAEIVSAIESAYGSDVPRNGDIVILTSGGRVPFFAKALPQDADSPSTDFGLHYRNITVNAQVQRFLISQTGTFF